MKSLGGLTSKLRFGKEEISGVDLEVITVVLILVEESSESKAKISEGFFTKEGLKKMQTSKVREGSGI